RAIISSLAALNSSGVQSNHRMGLPTNIRSMPSLSANSILGSAVQYASILRNLRTSSVMLYEEFPGVGISPTTESVFGKRPGKAIAPAVVVSVFLTNFRRDGLIDCGINTLDFV